MVDTGLKKAGYEYLVIDGMCTRSLTGVEVRLHVSCKSALFVSDGWSELNRGSDGKIVADPAKFPSGIKHVSDYVHSKGVHNTQTDHFKLKHTTPKQTVLGSCTASS